MGSELTYNGITVIHPGTVIIISVSGLSSKNSGNGNRSDVCVPYINRKLKLESEPKRCKLGII